MFWQSKSRCLMTDGLNPDPDLPDAFREAFRLHPAGAVIISADQGGQPVALTISSLISVSMSPPTVAFSLSAKSVLAPYPWRSRARRQASR
jgi:flavin reductase (DIM6/NTAB) family NADH-FMN oxidoreductase RutF